MKSSSLLFFMTILLAAACGDPCLPTVLADTSVIAADADCVPGNASTSEDASTSSDSGVVDNSECDADADCPEGQVCDLSVVDHVCVPVPATNPLTCVALPEGGKFWGPCIAGSCIEGACELSGGTSICVPGCTEDPCNVGVCFPGTCNDKWQCVGPCDGPEDCAPGMVCSDLKHCAWAE